MKQPSIQDQRRMMTAASDPRLSGPHTARMFIRPAGGLGDDPLGCVTAGVITGSPVDVSDPGAGELWDCEIYIVPVRKFGVGSHHQGRDLSSCLTASWFVDPVGGQLPVIGED